MRQFFLIVETIITSVVADVPFRSAAQRCVHESCELSKVEFSSDSKKGGEGERWKIMRHIKR